MANVAFKLYRDIVQFHLKVLTYFGCQLFWMSTIYNIMLCFFLDPNVFIHFLYYNNRQQISYDHGFLMKYSIFVGYHSQCLSGCGQKKKTREMYTWALKVMSVFCRSAETLLLKYCKPS